MLAKTKGNQCPRSQPEKCRAHGPDLLRQRMCVHGLDPDWFRLSEPEVVAQLQETCSTCKLHERCAKDLAGESFVPSRAGRHDYCLNADLLDIYSALASLYWRQDPQNNLIRKDALAARRRWKSALMRLARPSAVGKSVAAKVI